MNKFSLSIHLDDSIHLTCKAYFYKLRELSQRPCFAYLFFVRPNIVIISHVRILYHPNKSRDY